VRVVAGTFQEDRLIVGAEHGLAAVLERGELDLDRLCSRLQSAMLRVWILQCRPLEKTPGGPWSEHTGTLNVPR
jgi:hypothetical protein